jgi:hypothetical protein
VVALWPDLDIPTLQPHSVISLDFAKPMVDATGLFNEAVALNDGGFLTIGERSGWSAAFRLDAVTLTRDPDGAAEPVTLWGTWARETLEPNTTLRLQSSHRFGDDGSLTGGYLEDVSLDYCDQPTDTTRCVSLEAMQPGYGRLEDDSLYFWSDLIQIRLRVPRKTVDVIIECPDQNNTTKRVTLHLTTRGDDDLVVLSPRELAKCRLKELCFPAGHGRPNWHDINIRGGMSTGMESWTVPPELRLLPPGQLFELGIRHTALLKAPDGTVSEPLGSGAIVTKRFRTAGPPAYVHALDAYVGAINPSHGARPVYTSYDLTVQLVEDYVPALYSMVGEALVFRLFDGQGQPVRDADGHELHIPIIESVQTVPVLVDAVWEGLLTSNIEAGCAQVPPPPTHVGSILRLPLVARGIFLTANSHYSAWLVSDARPDTALHAWDFTTSSYGTFSALVTDGRTVGSARSLAAALVGGDFDALARAASVLTVGYADRFAVTPFVDAVGVQALVMESPEPLGFGSRLTVTVGGGDTVVHTNADGTRAFVRPAGAAWPVGPLPITLQWRRDVGPAAPRFAIDGNTTVEIVEFNVTAEPSP